MSWELVVGLEVHVQLETRSKLFSAAPNRFGDPPNTNVAPVELGLPGTLPVLNDRGVDLALMAALALECEVPDVSLFARKHYFYPDLPKGYQISQYDRPLARGGRVPIEIDGVRRTIRLVRIHLEEDAGKSFHGEGAARGAADSRIDLNRCGTPLIEIVSEPEIRQPEEAGAYLESLRRIVQYLGVSDGDMSQGSFRCDANVSVRRSGEAKLGTKTELKNLNSIKAVERAIEVEARRQIALLEAGREVVQATLLWDDRTEKVRLMRTKEDAPDYRYFPDPDLMPLAIDGARRRRVLAEIPELPLAKRDRFVAQYAIPAYDASVLTTSRPLADWFEDLVKEVGEPKLAANWTMGEVLRVLKERNLPIEEFPVRPASLAELLRLVRDGAISGGAAKTVFAKMVETRKSAEEIVREEGLSQISDRSALQAIVDGVIAENRQQVEQLRSGEQKVLSFLVGQAMKATRGKANPRLVSELLMQRVGRDDSP
jgi:aspartyl-tRNA(Asn)/glutamyl-tRNA(Gln) amidotransferase subunit B